ncbi:MAG: stage III sporulation protein AE [Lachnospiraceae bacterium]|nr:stage III sporulation protein AE [Lachnospiraceae bacterium]
MLKKYVAWLCLLLVLSFWPIRVRAARYDSLSETEEEQENSALLEAAEEYLALDEIEETLLELLGTEEFSFWETVKELLSGKVPFRWDRLVSILSDLFLNEWKRQRQLAVQILLVTLASAVFSNFVHVFDSRQISDISFYMTYLVLSALLLDAFSALAELVADTCAALNTFVEILLPSYVITIVLSAGSVTALGFYEIAVLAVGLIQAAVIRLALPAIRFYMVVLLFNQLSAEEIFSRLARLLETAISWGIKSMLGVVVGLQTVQCLITPAVDALKNTAFSRMVSVIPGIGQVLSAAAETVAGSAVVIKNAVGVAGILALLMICLTPFVKLVACVFLFRLICAAIQPVCEKRMVEGIESISAGTMLLLRVMLSVLAMFVILLAMITASVRGA